VAEPEDAAEPEVIAIGAVAAELEASAEPDLGSVRQGKRQRE
jgi:hypothetical protein